MRRTLSALLLLAPGAALAQSAVPVVPAPEPAPEVSPPPPPPPPAADVPPPPPGTSAQALTPAAPPAPPAEEPGLPLLGAAVDAGLPGGIGLSVVLRPTSWLELHGGPVHNTASFGGRAGVGIGAFSWAFTPTLTLQGGHLAEGAVSGLVGTLARVDVAGLSVAPRLSYTFVDAQVGLQAGGPHFGFFARVGVGYVNGTIGGFQAALRQATHDNTLEARDPTLTAVMPVATLGLVAFFR